MAKFTHIANSFKSGQLGQKLVGRTDISQYRNGLLDMKNMINSPVGGAFRRGGFSSFKKVTPPLLAYSSSLVVPFVVSNDESYLIVFYGRVSGNSFPPKPVIYNSSGVLQGTEGGVFGVNFFPEDATLLRWVQLGRFMFFCSADGNMRPFFLYQGASGDFEFRLYSIRPPVDFIDPLGLQTKDPEGFRYPYFPNTDENIFMKYVRGPNPTEDQIVMQDGSAVAVDYFADATLVGTFKFRALFGSSEILLAGAVKLSDSSIEVALETGTRPADGAIATDWGRGQWDDQLGWPRTVTSFQQRLIWGGNASFPNTLWSSSIAKPFRMIQEKLFQDQGSTDVTGAGFFGDLDTLQPFEFEIASSQATGITWLGSQRSLHVGTASMEFSLASDTGGFSAIEFPSLRPQTYHGGRNVQPARIGRFSIYVDESGKSIRDFAYSENNGSHISRDLSVLSPDIIYERLGSDNVENVSFKVMDWQESNRCLWLVSSGGSLFSFSYEETAELAGWAWHELGGDPVVLSCAVIPYQGKSTLFIVTQRTVDGSEELFLERLVPPTQDPVYVDGSQEVNYFDASTYVKYGVATDTHLSDLEGYEVYALADGEQLGPFTVTAGEFTTPTAVTEISYGLKYEHLMTTMPLEAGTVIGSAQGQLKRVDRFYMDMYRSLGSKFSYGDTEYPIEYPAIPALESFTGRVKIDYDSTPDERYLVTIKGDDPLPFGVLNITFRGVTQD